MSADKLHVPYDFFRLDESDGPETSSTLGGDIRTLDEAIARLPGVIPEEVCLEGREYYELLQATRRISGAVHTILEAQHEGGRVPYSLGEYEGLADQLIYAAEQTTDLLRDEFDDRLVSSTTALHGLAGAVREAGLSDDPRFSGVLEDADRVLDEERAIFDDPNLYGDETTS